jgi:hydroxymethylbilane synthase
LELHVAAHLLPRSIMLPAVGQGALGLEARSEDRATIAALVALDDPATHASVIAERAMLQSIGGGCLAPIGAWGRVESDGTLHLDAVVLSIDGATKLSASTAGPPNDFVTIGLRVAEALLSQGAIALIAECRDKFHSG